MSDHHQVTLDAGTVHYRERGTGPPVVFVHGLLVNGSLWHKVVDELEGNYRCIAPDWPLGSHSTAMRANADLSPPGLARLVADFLSALDLDAVTLVGNDTGGAICQLVATEHPERLARLVLTPCDAFENFLPPMFRPLQLAARVPGLLTAIVQTLRSRRLRTLPIAFGWLAKRPVDQQVMDGWVRPCLSDRAVRRDTGKVLRGISPRFTLAAAEKLAHFDRPTLIAWAPEDRFFPMNHAQRLAKSIPDARLDPILDSYTFVPQDQPARLAELIADFSS
ncbi:MAG: alpha/beta fold hydrolase [Geodermatophilaceae bacterium]